MSDSLVLAAGGTSRKMEIGPQLQRAVWSKSPPLSSMTQLQAKCTQALCADLAKLRLTSRAHAEALELFVQEAVRLGAGQAYQSAQD